MLNKLAVEIHAVGVQMIGPINCGGVALFSFIEYFGDVLLISPRLNNQLLHEVLTNLY